MRFSAPGKLMLSGEWSVLENEVPCIVMAINQKVNLEIKESEKINFSVLNSDLRVNAKFENKKLVLEGNKEEKNFFLFVSKAVEATLNYLEENNIKTKNFSIVTNSSDTKVKINEEKTAKVGFGSSAAIVVATVAAVLKFHGEGIESKKEKEIIYKLGCIAHYLAQGKIGSSFDVAASTYGGVLVYQKPDMEFVLKKLNEKTKIKELVKMNWPYFKAENINLPKGFLLSIGFVGYSASTKDLVLKINEFKKNNLDEYNNIILRIKKITVDLINAIKKEDEQLIIELLKQNRILLKELNDKSNNNLETKDLGLLSDIADFEGGAGKFSGAGGGDCGIAVSFNLETKNKIEENWTKNNIYLINANVSKTGVNLEN